MMFELFALLVFTHFLADYPLQGDFLAKGKNRLQPIPGIPFWHPLTAHSAIHGGFVGIITGSIWLGLAETVVHWITDDAKCRGKISYNVDQAIHIICKLIWVGVLFYV
jgi:hypothetical protein